MTDSTSTIQTVITDFLSSLFTNLFRDEAAVLQPVADTYLTGILTDPSPDNVIAKSIAYQAEALAVLPKGESVGLFDTATAIKAFIDAQVPALVMTVSNALAPAAPVATSAVTAASTSAAS